jgi:hypothetical protein
VGPEKQKRYVETIYKDDWGPKRVIVAGDCSEEGEETECKKEIYSEFREKSALTV